MMEMRERMGKWRFGEPESELCVITHIDDVYVRISNTHEIYEEDDYSYKKFDNFIYLPKDKAIELANFILEHTK